MTTSPGTAVTPPPVATSATANGSSGAARRPTPATLARRQGAEPLRERRNREENLIVSAIDALARRAVAIDEAASASEALTGAIRDLGTIGISGDELAQILAVSAAELGDPIPAGHKGARATRAK